MADEKSSGADVANLVAAGFAVITGAAGIVGGLTGGLARFARNDSIRVYASLLCALAAVLLALVAAQIRTDAPQAAGGDAAPTPMDDTPPTPEGDAAKTRRDDEVRKRGARRKASLTVAAFVLFGFSSWFTVDGLSRSLRHSDLPRVAGTWRTMGGGELAVLTVTVKMSGMKTSDILNVTVRPGAAVPPNATGGALAPFLVYQSRTGADPDGIADLTFDVPLPRGYAALQVVANLGDVPVTCGGTVVEKKDQNKSAVVTTKTPDASRQPTIFSCLTLVAPTATTPAPTAPSSTGPRGGTAGLAPTPTADP